MTLAAVMPLPEGMTELAFAGVLAGHRIPMICRRTADPAAPLPIYAEADFCISGHIDPERKLPEGPFGDHLGYYSLAHDFPVFHVEHVYHRDGAIWPFTVVGRPPQEDTIFGELIHELTGPVIPQVIPGVQAVHAVDAAGVHPLLLAIGSERYMPYEALRQPQELLTLANALLGQGQLSLAKYLWIVARDDDPQLDVHDIPAFFRHVLERVDWRRDLHFQTCTTIDTLDYSGSGLNEGSKVVIAAVGRALSDVADGGPRRPAIAGRVSRAAHLLARRAGRLRAAGHHDARRGGPGNRAFLPSRRRIGRRESFSPGRRGRRQRIHGANAEQFPLGHLHAEQSRRRYPRDRRVHAAKALGLPRVAGDRRPYQAAPRPAAGRRSGGDETSRRPGGAAGRWRNTCESAPFEK